MSDRSRDEIERAYGDAIYDAWRSGLNSDLVLYDRVTHYYYESYDPRSAAAAEVSYLRNHSRHEPEFDQQWPDEPDYCGPEEPYYPEEPHNGLL